MKIRSARVYPTGAPRRIATALLASAVVLLGAAPPARAADLQRYVSDRPPLELLRPPGWRVDAQTAPGSLRVQIAAPDGSAAVEIELTDNRAQRRDALAVLGAQLQALRAQHADLAASEASACKDGACAAVTVTWGRAAAATRSRHWVQADGNGAIVRRIRAPAADWSRARPMLLEVLANCHLREAGRAPAAAPVSLVARRPPDGSFSIELPADWKFQGGGGMVVASAPGGAPGFMFTTFQVMPASFGVASPPNVIVSGPRSPQDILPVIFARFGNRDVRVLGTQPDRATGERCLVEVRRPCQAADVQLGWTAPEGTRATGSFKVLAAQPNALGQWFVIVAGVWAPADDLGRQLPLLERVGDSFGIDDRYAKDYIRTGTQRLRELEARTRREIQGLNDQRAAHQADWEAGQARKDLAQSRWDDYRRGESYWVSEMEGGKVYRSDSSGLQDLSTGDRAEGAPHDYVHFEGENPRHPSETMREISSGELARISGAAR
jgi:hypothetical protein